MNNHPSNLDQWKRVLRAWPRLHPWQRKFILARALYSLVPRLKSPVVFALRASFAIFALLIILPQHPVSIPTAAGGGLAFALLTH